MNSGLIYCVHQLAKLEAEHVAQSTVEAEYVAMWSAGCMASSISY